MGKNDFSDANMLRIKAEKQLKENRQKKSIPEVDIDAKKLLHELQVHQIELEMQNEELRQAYATAEAALKKYTLLYDLSPLAYFTLDKEGTICELNFTGAELLQERRFSLVDSNFKLYVSEGSKSVFDNFIRAVYTSYAKESCEILLGYNNKSLCSVYMEGVVTEEDQKCLLSVVEISKFKSQSNP